MRSVRLPSNLARANPPLFAKLQINMGFAFFGQFLYSLSQYLFIVILTHVGGVSQVGTLILAFSVGAPIIMFCNLRLNLLLISDTQSENHFLDYLFLRLVMTGIGLIVISLIAVCFFKDAAIIIILIGVAKCFEAISDICFALMQKQELNVYVSISQMMKGLMMLVVFFVVYKSTHNLQWACLAFSLSWLTILIFYDLRVAARLSTMKINNYLREHFAHRLKILFYAGLPLSIVAGLNSLNTNVPRYFIGKMLDNQMLGYFAPPNYIFNASLIAVGMLLVAALPRLSKYYMNADKKSLIWLVSFLVFVVTAMGIASTVMTYFFGYQIVTILFGKVYAHYTYLLFLYMIAATFNYIALIFIYLLTAMRKLHTQIFLFLITFIITMICCYVLIPIYQLEGAVWAEIISGFVLALSVSIAACYAIRHMPKAVVE